MTYHLLACLFCVVFAQCISPTPTFSAAISPTLRGRYSSKAEWQPRDTFKAKARDKKWMTGPRTRTRTRFGLGYRMGIVWGGGGGGDTGSWSQELAQGPPAPAHQSVSVWMRNCVAFTSSPRQHNCHIKVMPDGYIPPPRTQGPDPPTSCHPGILASRRKVNWTQPESLPSLEDIRYLCAWRGEGGHKSQLQAF